MFFTWYFETFIIFLILCKMFLILNSCAFCSIFIYIFNILYLPQSWWLCPVLHYEIYIDWHMCIYLFCERNDTRFQIFLWTVHYFPFYGVMWLFICCLWWIYMDLIIYILTYLYWWNQYRFTNPYGTTLEFPYHGIYIDFEIYMYFIQRSFW